MSIVSIKVPVKIISEANNFDGWRKKAKRKREQRALACGALGDDIIGPPPPYAITLTRVGPRTLDDDNLASGFKAVRDGVADWLGIDDGDKRLTWRYAQRKGAPKEYAAEIVIEAVEA
jgi:hypothetical protein